MRKLYYEDEDFRLEYAEMYDEVFLHCIVHNWKLSSLKRGYRIFGQFLNEMTEKAIPRVVTVTPNPKFAQLLGGQFVQMATDDKGESYEVYQWVLK